MEDESNYLRWLEVSENKPIKFEDLAHLIADAMWPDGGADDDRAHYGVARIALEKELRTAAEGGELLPRNASTLKRESFLVGAALGRTVVLPQDLGTYLRKRGGIGLRLIPHGCGPNHWTIEHAAAAIAAQEGWHAGSRDALRARMMEAAAKGELVIRDPQTTLPYRPERVREFWEILTPADVNAWLQAQGAPYRWNVLTDLEAQDAFAKFDPLQARYDDERSNQKYAVAWWNSALKASMWWELKSIKPREAAMLLCGLNPHGREATGEALAPEGEPSADDYKTLLRYFDDEAQDAQARTLQQWLDFATRKGLSHHSWIDEWLEAMPTARASSGASATEPAGRAGSAVWTKERKEEARAMLERLQGQGLKNYAATTAKAFGVSGSRLREVLKDKKEKGTPKKLNNSAFTWRRSSTKER